VNSVGYSVADLEKVERELAELTEKESRYSGNNPDKYAAGIRSLQRQRDTIAAELKRRGEIPETEEEALNLRLDEAFPNPRSRQVIKFEGARYRKRFIPAETSRSGKSVTRWDSFWEPVDEE
jgi:hypothetical protein